MGNETSCCIFDDDDEDELYREAGYGVVEKKYLYSILKFCFCFDRVTANIHQSTDFNVNGEKNYGRICEYRYYSHSDGGSSYTKVLHCKYCKKHNYRL